MSLNLQAIAFLVGCGLIIVAILGGGVEVKEMKIPPLAPVPRTLTAFFGALLIVGATGVASGMMGWAAPTQEAAVQQNQQAPAAAAQPAVGSDLQAATNTMSQPPPADQPAQTFFAASDGSDEAGREVTFTDNLGDEQVLERMNVYVNGTRVGQLSVDHMQPRQSIRFRVQDGDSYELSGTETSRAEDGSLRVRTIRGDGSFNSEDSRYRLDAVSSDDQTIIARAVPQ